MSQRPFRLKLAELKLGRHYTSLDFTADDGSHDLGFNPVTFEACGEHINYATLFAYLFRRFGYPNSGWDDYKELVEYRLTTPHPDMVLSIVPYVGNTATITFTFLAPVEVSRAGDAYQQRFRMSWRKRFLAFAKTQQAPEWAADWIAFCNGDLQKYWGKLPAMTHWWETLQCMQGAHGKPGTKLRKFTERANGFLTQLRASYEKKHPYPDYVRRSANWREWSDKDPLKPYAEAAYVALQDLRRPVGVRDCLINAYGPTESRWGGAKRAAVAGYPSGNLGNAAPEAFSELHGIVLQLGNGNAKRGIRKAIKLLSPSPLRATR